MIRRLSEIDVMMIQAALRQYDPVGWSVSTQTGEPLCGFVPNEGAAPVRFVLSDKYFENHGRR